MYKEVLNAISGIEIFPVISFVIFFTFFIGILAWTYSRDRNYIDHMSNLPFDNEQHGD